MKLCLNLQMISWPRSQLFTNHLHHQPDPPHPPIGAGTIKLIKSDGIVEIFTKPINVSHIMAEFPKHMICRSDSLYIGQKIAALSEDDQLQLGHNYFLLPKHFFQSVLTFVTVASFARNVLLKKAAAVQPLDIQKTPSGCLRIRVSDDFISQYLMKAAEKEDDEDKSNRGVLCSTPELRKDYTRLVHQSRRQRHWKPKLETIHEITSGKRKISSFGMKRRSSKN